MKFKTFALADGENPFHFESQKDGWLREVMSHVRQSGVGLAGNLQLDGTITKLAPEYFVKGELKYTLEQACHRCAEEFQRPIKHKFGVALAEMPKDAEDLEPDEGDVTYFQNGELDLQPVIEEQIVLSLPYQAVCKPDCAGIRVDSNQDTSGGPFAVLKKLKK